MTPRKKAPGTLAHLKAAHVDDIEIAYQEIGSGAPLLLIAGYGMTMTWWGRHFIEPLSVFNRVIIFDNRGVGRSTSSDKTYSIPLFADDAVGLLGALRIKKASILGYSMGSFIAQEAALRHPESVQKLILLSGHAGGESAIPAQPQGIEALNAMLGTPEEAIKGLLKGAFPAEWSREHPDTQDYFPIDPDMVPGVDTLNRQLRAMEHWAGASSRLGQLNLPTLVLTGDSDTIIPGENSMMLARAIPSSWLIRIRRGGHGLPFQYPRLVADEIALFLKGEE